MLESISSRPTVAVCGSSTIPQSGLENMAEEVGREIIRSGMNLVCGGMGGVMEAACRGAYKARQDGDGNGIIVGILPGRDKAEANAYCDVVVPTGIGLARNILVVQAAEAVILVHGGSGTLSEASFAWQLGLPVVALSTTGGWAEKLAGEQLDRRREDRVLKARSPSEALALVRDELAR